MSRLMKTLAVPSVRPLLAVSLAVECRCWSLAHPQSPSAHKTWRERQAVPNGELGKSTAMASEV
jgi:hypothetical protein